MQNNLYILIGQASCSLGDQLLRLSASQRNGKVAMTPLYVTDELRGSAHSELDLSFNLRFKKSTNL